MRSPAATSVGGADAANVVGGAGGADGVWDAGAALPVWGRAPLRGVRAAHSYVRFLRDPIAAMREMADRYGRLCVVGQSRAWARREHLYFLALGPDFNRAVLGHPERFRTTGQGLSGPRGSSLRRIRNGLTRSRGEKHQKMRQLLVPLFQRRGIERTHDTVLAVADEVLAGWRVGDPVDLAEEMRRITLRVASEVLFALDDRAASHALGEMVRDFAQRSFSLRVLAFAVDVPGTPYHALKRHAERIEARIDALVAERRAGALEGADAVSRMLRARRDGAAWLDEADLVGQTTLLFTASHETTALALTWTLLLLAQHPKWGEAVADEVRGALGDGAPTAPALADLPLLDAAIKESMRLLPPVPYTIRTAMAAERLSDVEVRRGDKVICSHYFTHHMPELYARPDEFEPERWTTIRPDPYAYLPFSTPPRMCIGAGFANSVMKTVLARVLQRARPTLADGQRVDRSVRITLAPRGGLPVTLRAPGDGFRAADLRGNLREMVRFS